MHAPAERPVEHTAPSNGRASAARAVPRRHTNGALACVVGDIDLVRPLGLAGIDCAVMAPPGDPSRYSRFNRLTLDWVDPWQRAGEFVDQLLAFAETQAEMPVLFYESDAELLAISRMRDRLAGAFRFVIASSELVEGLVDKSRFLDLARRLGLPVPAARVLQPGHEAMDEIPALGFPVVLKPLVRRAEDWGPISGSAKAVHVKDSGQLRELWPALVRSGKPLLAQHAVPGPESRIESYHAYVDAGGAVVAEFTGKKIRTYPAQYGYSTALEITETADVRALGREIVTRLGCRGVLKLDFKRAPDGGLALLEVNPRFTLWHHLAAKAGLNIPALVYRDLVGLPRGTVPEARAGARWCYHFHDARAARAQGIGLVRWSAWATGCDAKSAFALSDMLPFLRGVLGGLVARRWRSFRHHG